MRQIIEEGNKVENIGELIKTRKVSLKRWKNQEGFIKRL